MFFVCFFLEGCHCFTCLKFVRRSLLLSQMLLSSLVLLCYHERKSRAHRGYYRQCREFPQKTQSSSIRVLLAQLRILTPHYPWPDSKYPYPTLTPTLDALLMSKRRRTVPDRPTVTQRRDSSDMTDRLAESPRPYSVDKGKMIEPRVPLPDPRGEHMNRVH